MSTTIFIVSSDDSGLIAMAEALEESYRVLTMPDAESIFSFSDKIRPDLILLETVIPDKRVYDTVAKLKSNQDWKHIPIVFIAEKVAGELLSDALKAGAEDVLKKPVADSVLRNAARKHTGEETKPSVLVVDDQETSIAELVEILNHDYIVYEASSGKIAIQEAEKYTPDVILLDIMMPEMDGYAAIEVLRKNEKTSGIPTIFVTSLKGHDDEEKGLESGAADYITKPFNPATVLLRVKNQIRIVNHSRTYDDRLRQQELLTRISNNFLSGDRTDTLISDTLKMVGEFMDLAKVRLYRFEDDKTLRCQSEWLNPEMNLKPYIGVDIEISDDFDILIKKLLASDDYYCISSNTPAHKEALKPFREDYDRFISTPIYVKGKINSVLDFTGIGEDYLWDDSDMGLAVLLSDIFSGVFERDAIEYDLNVVLKLKEELNEAKQHAERSSRAKSEFLSRMSHEMLTPMNAIMGMMQIVQISGSLDGIKNCIEDIGDASVHMVKLIKNVLDVSGGGSTITFVQTAFAFDSMLDYVLSRINPEVEKKNQQFIMDISQSVPEIMVGDERRIAQVIVHLLTNASKFTQEKGTIHFDARLVDEEDNVITLQFDVTDNGIGIPEDQHEIIFDIFEQMDGGLNRKQGGIGIGLALSKLIVEMMGGRIWLESEAGKGAKFSFTCKVLKV